MIDVVLINGETWLICGGRDFTDQQMFDSAMGDVIRMFGMPIHIVHGACPTGADKMADTWAVSRAIDVTRVHAEWDKHGKAAGPIRNQGMLDRYPIRRMVAFPGGRGTTDMVTRGHAKPGVDVIEIQPKETQP